MAARNENDSILSCRSYRVSVNKDQTTEISLSIILNSNRLRCQNLRSIYSTWISQRVCCLFRFFFTFDHSQPTIKKRNYIPRDYCTWNLNMRVSQRNLLFQGCIIKLWQVNSRPNFLHQTYFVGNPRV